MSSFIRAREKNVVFKSLIDLSYYTEKESDFLHFAGLSPRLDTLPTPFDAAMRAAGVALPLPLGGGVSDSSSFRLAWS